MLKKQRCAESMLTYVGRCLAYAHYKNDWESETNEQENQWWKDLRRKEKRVMQITWGSTSVSNAFSPTLSTVNWSPVEQ